MIRACATPGAIVDNKVIRLERTHCFRTVCRGSVALAWMRRVVMSESMGADIAVDDGR